MDGEPGRYGVIIGGLYGELTRQSVTEHLSQYAMTPHCMNEFVNESSQTSQAPR